MAVVAQESPKTSPRSPRKLPTESSEERPKIQTVATAAIDGANLREPSPAYILTWASSLLTVGSLNTILSLISITQIDDCIENFPKKERSDKIVIIAIIALGGIYLFFNPAGLMTFLTLESIMNVSLVAKHLVNVYNEEEKLDWRSHMQSAIVAVGCAFGALHFGALTIAVQAPFRAASILASAFSIKFFGQSPNLAKYSWQIVS